MRRGIFLTLAALILIAAGVVYATRDAAPRDQTQGQESSTYLPIGNIPFGPYAGEAEFTEEWIAEALRAAREPILSRAGDRRDQAYVLRLSFLPSFDGATTVRISSRDGRSGEALVTTLDDRADMPPTAIAEQTRISLSPARLSHIKALAENAQIASAPFANDMAGCDGMAVFFEIGDARGYRVIKRDSSGFSAAQLALMRTLLDLHKSPRAKAAEYLDGDEPFEETALPANWWEELKKWWR